MDKTEGRSISHSICSKGEHRNTEHERSIEDLEAQTTMKQGYREKHLNGRQDVHYDRSLIDTSRGRVVINLARYATGLERSAVQIRYSHSSPLGKYPSEPFIFSFEPIFRPRFWTRTARLGSSGAIQ
jgi:hypothetical protein